MHFVSRRFSNKKIDLAKITVILGANGSGKSTVLREAKENVGIISPGKKVVYIEGGRTIKLIDTLQLTHDNVQ